MHYTTERLKPKFEKSVTERTKLKRTKKSDHKQPDTTDMPDLESEESAERKRKHRLEILTTS